MVGVGRDALRTMLSALLAYLYFCVRVPLLILIPAHTASTPLVGPDIEPTR